MKHTRLLISVAFVVSSVATASCGKDAPPPPPPDPKRCEIADLGEASDAIAKGPLPDDKMVRVTGINSPKSLVWQDPTTKQAYFVARITGAEDRWLYYMQPLGVGETPKVLSVFEGHLQRWDSMPKEKAIPIAGALKKNYQAEIDFTKTWLITAGSKPDGCP